MPSKENRIRRKIIITKCFLIIHLLVVLLVLSIALASLITAATVFQLPATKKSLQLITENTTVLLQSYKIRKHETAVASIKEKVLDEDAFHTNYISIVPSSKVIVHRELSRESHSVLPISDDAVAVNQRYIYMLSDSVLNYTICLGNAPRQSDTVLYGFNSEESYDNFVTSSILSLDYVFSKRFRIGGRNETVCAKASFTSNATGYYFFVLKTKDANTNVDYTVVADLNRLEIKDYLNTYNTCRIDGSHHSCSLEFGPGHWSLIGWSERNFDFGSRLSHVEVSLSRKLDRSWSVLYQALLLIGIGLFSGSIFYIVVLTVIISFVNLLQWRRNKQSKFLYTKY